MSPSLRVGLAVGLGTGPELAQTFEKVIQRLAERSSVNVELVRDSRMYHTYVSLDPESKDPQEIQDETNKDVEAYELFCQNLVMKGCNVIFRTAINAQTLYTIREHQEAIKVDHFTKGDLSLLLVRDQAQGFYTGANEHDLINASIARRCKFSKALTERILAWAIERAQQSWGVGGIDSVVMVYKFHLLDGVMSAWASEWSKKYGMSITYVQPDTANRNLLAKQYKGRQLMIAGNEWADIMHVILLDTFDVGVHETQCTENVYLRTDLQGLVEYQTVHGSADAISGKAIVNPFATIRAAARILDQHGGISGLQDRIEAILHGLTRRKAITQDQGGYLSTNAVVNLVLESFDNSKTGEQNGNIPNSPSISHVAPMKPNKPNGTLVVVIDFQNDFVLSEDVDSSHQVDLIRKTSQLVSHLRAKNQEVAFVRFLGDRAFQLENWRTRNDMLGKQTKCLEGSWGAAWPDKLQPAQGDRVFDKKAHFDAFLSDNFEEYLVSKGVQHLIFVGLYLDVCIDSTARTAFQKGYYVTIVSDCTNTLHLDLEPYLAYMKKLYGARIVSSDDLISRNGSYGNGAESK